MPLPRPYWCPNAAGDGYVRTVHTSSGAESAEPCNPEAAEMGGKYAFLMMVASLGYCIADVAADGLTVSLARAEPPEKRGQTQTTVYLVRTLGNVVAVAIVGICMNSWKYNGSFSWGLSYSSIMGLFAVPAALMVPVSWALVKEQRVVAVAVELKKDEEDDLPALPDGAAYEAKRTFRQYAANVFELLRGRAMLFVILYQFLTPIVGGVSTTAGGEVKQYWAHVKTFQNACFSLVGLGLFAAGLYLVKTRLLDQSWRHMLLVTTVFLNVVDMPFTFCTIFDVVRDQYFYLGETVLVEIPAAANFVVSAFVIAISNQIFGLWSPSLSDSSNYIEDAPSFRISVALSFAVSYFFAFASLATLPLLPNQKDEAQERKRKWEKRDAYAYVSMGLVLAGLVHSVTVNFLAMFPSTMCLKIAGGEGCGNDDDDDDGR
ncbi:hypothetical protein JL722_12650 [Aureococcus anophagefferens]|nr:hypothetical protein JL722_12650 [Aureococcus anophagefferens]